MSQQQAAIDQLTEDAIVLIGRPSAALQKILPRIMGICLLIGTVLGFGVVTRVLGPLPPKVLMYFLLIMAAMVPLLWLYMRWVMRLVQKRIESRKTPVTLRIDSQGISVQDVFGIHGPVPWAVLGELTPRTFIFPMVHFALTDVAAAKKALGSRYWYLWFPGGLGIRTDLFGMPSEELIARINRYRQHGLG